MARATIFRWHDGRLALKSPYNARLVEALKANLWSHEREWDPVARVWLFDEENLHIVKQLLNSVGYGTSPPQPPPTKEGGTWATEMFAALPPHLHKSAYLALSKVVHPDTGGDVEVMKQLNEAHRALR